MLYKKIVQDIGVSAYIIIIFIILYYLTPHCFIGHIMYSNPTTGTYTSLAPQITKNFSVLKTVLFPGGGLSQG